VYPHVQEFVLRTCRELGANLKIVRPEMDAHKFTERFGLPSDVIPMESTEVMAQFAAIKPKTLLQPAVNCCSKMLWEPMQRSIKESGIKLVLRGTKACDHRQGVPHGHIDEDGIEYRSPLWDWSHDQVMEYLTGKELPDQYPEIMDSMDCWICTGHMTGEYAKAKLDYAKLKYPELWPHLEDRIVRVREAIESETDKLNQAWAGIGSSRSS
jgi:3'-phosphoadenosine 5'-phosphosulfate sulfotransferase (PAPS reductase)/FAD synthetase